MCSCSKSKTAKTAKKYTVTYPGGGTQTMTSELAAKLAAGKVPGAKYAAAEA